MSMYRYIHSIQRIDLFVMFVVECYWTNHNTDIEKIQTFKCEYLYLKCTQNHKYMCSVLN